jgi:hypothetical protein
VALEARAISKARKSLGSVFEKKLSTKLLRVEHRFVDEDCAQVYATTPLSNMDPLALLILFYELSKNMF